MAEAYKSFVIGGTVNIAATTSSGTVTLTTTPLNRKDVIVYNSGATIAFIKFGGSGVTAATTDTPIAPGLQRAFHVADATHAAAIMGSGTATVYFTTGFGN